MGRDDAQKDQRSTTRHEVSWAVDCEAEATFLYAYITNISEMGVFVRTSEPLPVGTCVKLAFGVGETEPKLELQGQVQWVNGRLAFGVAIDPGMGIVFVGLTESERADLVSLIKTIAYLHAPPSVQAN